MVERVLGKIETLLKQNDFVVTNCDTTKTKENDYLLFKVDVLKDEEVAYQDEDFTVYETIHEVKDMGRVDKDKLVVYFKLWKDDHGMFRFIIDINERVYVSSSYFMNTIDLKDKDEDIEITISADLFYKHFGVRLEKIIDLIFERGLYFVKCNEECFDDNLIAEFKAFLDKKNQRATIDIIIHLIKEVDKTIKPLKNRFFIHTFYGNNFDFEIGIGKDEESGQLTVYREIDIYRGNSINDITPPSSLMKPAVDDYEYIKFKNKLDVPDRDSNLVLILNEYAYSNTTIIYHLYLYNLEEDQHPESNPILEVEYSHSNVYITFFDDTNKPLKIFNLRTKDKKILYKLLQYIYNIKQTFIPV